MPELRLLDPDGYTVPGTAQTVPDADEPAVRHHLKTVVAPQHAAQWLDFGYHARDYRVLPETLPAKEQHMPKPASWPVFTLQRWDWTNNKWDTDTEQTYESERGEDNAYFAVSSERASQTGPIRLLKDGAEVLADNPATYYSDTDW